jgi:hypothetical protein
MMSEKPGFFSALSLVLITLITFAFAMTAVPISGAFCKENGVSYPYLDTAGQFPHDFLWMIPAMLLIICYLLVMVFIHSSTRSERQPFSRAGLAFAMIAAILLLTDYFIQISVVPVSLIKGETDGLPLLIQYNSHGIFLALEELGYLMMSLSFIFITFAFGAGTRLESAIRRIFVISFFLVAVSFVLILLRYGIHRQDRFEVVVISINWLTLIVNGALLSVWFKRNSKTA